MITAIGKLLSSCYKRKAFELNSHALAGVLNVNDDQRTGFLALDIARLEAQEYLFDYAEQYWPQGNNRHRLDANALVNYLMGINIIFCKDELNRFRFYSGNKTFSVHSR